jgi:Zn ribbon nucleic-acid-binding protein
MPLSEASFTDLVDAGCPDCKAKRIVVETYVAQRLPLLEGEIYGAPSWGYKGEDLVQGTYRIACDGCSKELFAAAGCPRCEAEDGLARALETENAFPLPTSCTGCGSAQVIATAFVPAVVIYEGKRAAKARTQTAPEDPGFHAFRAECKQCRNVAEQRFPCPLCSEPT